MSVFFPVAQHGTPSVEVVSRVDVSADGMESAWSIMQRLAIAASMAGNVPFTLSVNESTKVLTLAATGVFDLVISTGSAYTGFVTASGSASYNSSAITDAVVVDGCAVSGPGYSFGTGQPSANGAAAGGGLFRASGVTIECQASYAAAYAAAKTLRHGVWDVVDSGRWLTRVRSTGVTLTPQGRKQGIVTLTISGQVVA